MAASLPAPRPSLALAALALLAGVSGVGAPAPPPVSGSAAAAAPPTDTTTPATPRIVAVYPNPVTPEDRGEYVRIAVPPDTSLDGWSLADDDAAVALPDRDVSGTVTLSTRPASVTGAANETVLALPTGLSLANGGERLALRYANHTVDAVRYADAPESEVWHRSAGWRPLGATNFSTTAASNVSVTALALPDASEGVLAALTGARRRIRLAAYTFESPRVARALERAAERGVDVHVLVEGGPVGGVHEREARLLDGLAAAGVNVTVLDGPRSRYRFHHPKYAVVDDRAVVTSENWGPPGAVGDNRGWGVVVRDPALAADLAAVFRADVGWRDGRRWSSYRRTATFQNGSGHTSGAFPRRFPSVEARADAVRLLVAPDNAGRAVSRLLRSAEASIRIQQVRVDPNSTLLAATLAAARRGVRVRLLLGGAWFVAEENRRLARRLRERARREGLPLAVRLAEPRSRFERVHVKGVVVDGERVVVGSLNWNPTAVEENREVAVVVEDRRVARYFRRVFRADWRGGAWRLPWGVAVALVPAVALAVALARRAVQFGDRRAGVGPRDSGWRDP